VKIADFGLLLQLKSLNEVCSDMKGTGKYFAPERVNQNFSTGADVWALGITLIETYRQQLLPADELDFFTIVDGINWDNYFDASAPKELVSFIKECLIQDPAQRPNAFQLLQHSFITTPWGPALSSPLSHGEALAHLRKVSKKPLVQFAVVEQNQKTLDRLLKWLEEWVVVSDGHGSPNSDVFEHGRPEDMQQCVLNLSNYSGYPPNYIDAYIAGILAELLGG